MSSSAPLPSGPDRPGGALDARWILGAWFFRDENLRRLEFLLDEAFRIPGTRVRFGIDGIIGLVPILGDVIAGLLSLVIPLAAWVRGLPGVAIVRMATNVSIAVLVGSVPLLGDAFDIFWKANRRNYRLLQRYLAQPRRHTWRDWLFLAALLAVIAAIFALPLALFAWLVFWLLHR